MHGQANEYVSTVITETSVAVINSGRSRCPHLLKYARELFKVAALGQFSIRAAHCAGTTNRIADALSRWNDDPKYRRTFYELTKNNIITEHVINDNIFECQYNL